MCRAENMLVMAGSAHTFLLNIHNRPVVFYDM